MSDPEKKIAAAYGVLNEKAGFANRHTIYIDKAGVVKSIYTKVNAKEHGKDVVKKLEELKIPKKGK